MPEGPHKAFAFFTVMYKRRSAQSEPRERLFLSIPLTYTVFAFVHSDPSATYGLIYGMRGRWSVGTGLNLTSLSNFQLKERYGRLQKSGIASAL